MGKTTKVPSQAASGKDTFNDSLVGFQITDGTSQLTNTSFTLDKVIPEKDDKIFISQPFSDFLTLDSINEERTTLIDDNETSVKRATKDIKFYNSKNDGSKSLFGSLKNRLNVSVVNIIKKYPAALYVDADSPISTNDNTAESIIYDPISNITQFNIQVSLLYNPMDVTIRAKKGIPTEESEKDIRNFYSSYKKYVVVIGNAQYDIIDYREPNFNNKVHIKVNGNCFSGATTYSTSYLIRPNNGVVEEFYQGLDDLESILLNRETIPIFQSKFKIPKDNVNSSAKTGLVTVTWPLSRDGWNIQIVGSAYQEYIEDLISIGDQVDDYKSNLIIRFLTSPQIHEFDTVDKKMEMAFQIYGQNFDKVKKYIDNIAYMRNVSYDKINNVPDILLKNLCETLGLSAIDLLDEKSLNKSLYERHESQYNGVGLGQNIIEAEYEFYRRLLTNLAYLYKSKGTRNCIEFFLKFIGAPEPMIVFNEYTYGVTSGLPDTYENDIADLLLGVKYNYSTQWNPTTSGYTLISTTGATTLTRDEYPVDENGLPRSIKSSDGTMFFGKGSGWYRSTIDHRGPDVLDMENSVLTGNTKIIKTKGKSFTYGEDYFDNFRKLPGLDYGYEITKIVDNKKTMNVLSTNQQKSILNRKNVSIFISADRAIDFDIYTKGRNMGVAFGDLKPQTDVTFAEFLDKTLSEIIDNSHTIRFKKQYSDLALIYTNYMNSVGFTPYNYIKLNEFINQLSPYWTSILDQFIPATTQWLGGNLIGNSLFNRSKHQYIIPCSPTEFVHNLYPNFETIRKDLITILGGGTLEGADVAVDHLRGLLAFKDMFYNLYLRVNDETYSGETAVIKHEIFQGFTPNVDCTSLVPTTDTIPLICGHNDWLNIILPEIKALWKTAFNNIVTEMLNDFNISVEYFTDFDGVEKVKFIANTAYAIGGTCIENIDFHFDPQYSVDETECGMRVEVFTLRNVYSSEIFESCISEDVFIAVINNSDGYNVGIEKNNDWPINFYIASGSTCNTSTCGVCNMSEISVEPILSTNIACIYYLRKIKETDVFDIIVSDAANCEQRVKINGLKTECVNIGGNKGYVIYPNLQYKTSYDHGLKKGTTVFKKAGNINIEDINDWEDLEIAISSGNIVETPIDDVELYDLLLSITPKLPTEASAYNYRNIMTNGAGFAFDYNFILVENIDCFSSIKKYVINGIYDVLPTTKLYVYTNIDETTSTRIPYQFKYKYPEDLYVKPITPASCCEEQENGDYLLDQDGFLIEVTEKELNYCDRGVYYQLNTSSGDNVLFNGPEAANKIVVYHEEEQFTCLAMSLVDQFDNDACLSDRNACDDVLCGNITTNTLFMHIPNL